MAVYGKIPMFSGHVPGRKPGSRNEGIINLVNHKRKIEILNFKNIKAEQASKYLYLFSFFCSL